VDVSFRWDQNSEPDLAGYKVFCREEGQSYNYTNPSWEGTDTMCTIYDLDETKTYYFVVRAFDTEGLESENANELCHIPAVIPENIPPITEVTIEAEDMPIKTTGGSTTDGWNIWSNGYIADDVSFPTGGTYTFEVSAKGNFAGGAWSIMEVRIDQTVVETFTVDSSSWFVYTIEAYVTSGMHEVAIAFTNDYYNPPEDRNLLIDKIIITEAGGNQPPVADAGPDQTVDEGQVVTLNGSNSRDSDDGIASYHWVQTGGLQVNLSAPDSQQTTFTAPEVGAEGTTLTFELTVVDHSGAQNTDGCVVNITWQNEPPEANAGTDQTVDEGGVVVLNGSSSLDIDNGIAAYLWTQISGPLVSLSDPASSQPAFTPPNVGPEGASFTFSLTVTDAGGLQDTDLCIVNISWQNEPPTAMVAEEYIQAAPGTTVMLDGSGSTDSDDGISSYLWTQVDGTPVTLFDHNSNLATFIAPETDKYGSNLTFKLTVTDFGWLQSTAICFVYVTNDVQADNVTITSATYIRKLNRLVIEALSVAPVDSVTLTAWGNYGTGTIKLGDLKYSFTKSIYRNTFKKIDAPPDSITVTSSGSGADTWYLSK